MLSMLSPISIDTIGTIADSIDDIDSIDSYRQEFLYYRYCNPSEYTKARRIIPKVDPDSFLAKHMLQYNCAGRCTMTNYYDILQ